ncbi:MAG: helix-turn-helix domain-containing protein [Saprospiraceae bacterium]
MQSTEVPVYTIGLFGDSVRHFWMGELGGLLERFPLLEFPHKQDFYALILIEEADGEIHIDNDRVKLDSPKAIIVKPRCINHISINRKAHGTMICFTEDFFSLRYNNNILYQFTFLQSESMPYIRLTQEQKTKFGLLLRLLSDEYSLRKRETKKVLRSYLNITLFELERCYRPFGQVKAKNLKQEKVHEFERLIDKHFEEKKLPSAYADLLHVSPNYLNKICKEETGQTAGELIRKRIMIEAQRLLHYTNYSVNEIADKLGFENPSYFITFFKKNAGTTPEQFRKNQTV